MNLLFAVQQFFLINLFVIGSFSPINDFMRSIGKIWVVVASIAIIFIAIVIFLFIVENKISKIEKELKDE